MDSDDEGPLDVGAAPQAEEAREDHGSDDDIEALFKPKSTRRRERTEAEHKALRSEAADLVAEMDVAADQDTAARAAGQLGVAKLRLLEEVERQLCRVELQQLCLDHNLLSALATWLRPGADGSLPNLRLRSSLLALCSRLPVDTQQQDGREQLKRSGLGKVIMFYKLHDEVAANRNIAAHLVETCSRPIFALSAVYKARAPRGGRAARCGGLSARARAQDLDREQTEVPAHQLEPDAARRRAAATAHEAELVDGNKDGRLQPGDVRTLHASLVLRVLTRCCTAGLPPPRRNPRGRAPGLRAPPRVQGTAWALRRTRCADAWLAQVSSKAAAKGGKSEKDLTGGAKIVKELSTKRGNVKNSFSAHKVSRGGGWCCAIETTHEDGFMLSRSSSRRESRWPVRHQLAS